MRVDGDLALLEALEQGGLGLGRGPVDLVADHDVREDTPGAELELAGLLVEDRHPGDVRRQQVGRELDPTRRPPDGTGQCLGQLGLAHPGHVLQQQVPLGQQDDQGGLDHLGLALDDLGDVAPQSLGDGRDVDAGLHIRHVSKPTRKAVVAAASPVQPAEVEVWGEKKGAKGGMVVDGGGKWGSVGQSGGRGH